jgi:hypothetical protein
MNWCVVSAFYCPDGKRYEWRTDERGAKLLREMLENKAKQPGGKWVDVKVEVA